MINKTSFYKNAGILIPLWGSLLFTALYVAAALLYPGGSQVDKNAVGFSWRNNYWCNLLNDDAINGQHNAARPVALTALFILCFTLACFWHLFPRYMLTGKYSRLTIQLSGTVSMTIALFLGTGLHDIIIDAASAFGLLALSGVFVGLYKNNWYTLFWYGILNLLLVALNNYLYYTKGLIGYLPVVQKVSFAAFLVWVCCIDVEIYRKINSNHPGWRAADEQDRLDSRAW